MKKLRRRALRWQRPCIEVEPMDGMLESKTKLYIEEAIRVLMVFLALLCADL